MSVHSTTTREVSVPSEASTITSASCRTPEAPLAWKSLCVAQVLLVARNLPVVEVPGTAVVSLCLASAALSRNAAVPESSLVLRQIPYLVSPVMSVQLRAYLRRVAASRRPTAPSRSPACGTRSRNRFELLPIALVATIQ